MPPRSESCLENSRKARGGRGKRVPVWALQGHSGGAVAAQVDSEATVSFPTGLCWHLRSRETERARPQEPKHRSPRPRSAGIAPPSGPSPLRVPCFLPEFSTPGSRGCEQLPSSPVGCQRRVRCREGNRRLMVDPWVSVCRRSQRLQPRCTSRAECLGPGHVRWCGVRGPWLASEF